MVNHVRWYVNIAKWKPTREEWIKLSSGIACNELERINNYLFQEDLKSSLIGRALIKKFLSEATSIPSNEIVLTRTDKGRPEVSTAYKQSKGATWPSMIDFNVSHSGDYCVLAGVWSQRESPMIKVGVDVTKIVRKNSKTELDRFLDLMSRRPFTPAEWKSVANVSSDRQKCINFTRLWCLKESYIKATGEGLAFKLQRIDFRFSERHKWDISMDTLRNNILSDTTVMLDNQPAKDWRFYETALDDEHIVALGYNIFNAIENDETYLSNQEFINLPVKSIADSLIPMRAFNENDWVHFTSRSVKSI